MAKYLIHIRRLGLAALIIFLFGFLFSAASGSLFSEEQRSGVLVNAVPFIAYFVTVLLIYILGIVLFAVRFNGVIPTRVHTPIERTIIAGILFGIFCLFQPWQIVSFRYGFLLLLISLFSFIFWSHIVPRNVRQYVEMPAYKPAHHIIALVIALIVVVVQVAALANAAAPQPPYGLRQRAWDLMREDQKAEVVTQATANFYSAEIPYFVIVSLFLASIVYFAAREIVSGGEGGSKQIQSGAAHATPIRSG